MTSRRTALALCAGMAATAVAAEWARPTIKLSKAGEGFTLDKLFPSSFGAWSLDPGAPVVLPPPDQQALLDKIYNQTLARTYVHQSKYRIMLSVAYGGDQSDGLTVHIPDVCYVAQGFRMVEAADGVVSLAGGTIPVRDLVMVMGTRREPVTYWVLMGDEATISNAQRRMVSIRYGLKRQIPEGMLVRISSINANYPEALDWHRRFALDLWQALPPDDRVRVFGRPQARAQG